jgi:catechol 2,3-dioxygenase-like lactoylglutathione lyase family enzyme
MRLDHIAYRVANRDDTVKFFMDAFGYTFQAEFDILFNDSGTDKALCIALEPPEKIAGAPFSALMPLPLATGTEPVTLHMAPEIFVSQGTPGSIVFEWVKARAGVGGIHHLAYEVADVEAKRQEWIARGWGDFTSDKAFHCDDLTQIFTKPHQLTGVIYEFITRKGQGFCKDNVKELMKSTVNADRNIR